MDRSFLSQPAVIAAARDFVCCRLTTYENADENAFLKSLFTGRSGEVENTTMTVLAPDGKTPLTRVSRGTKQVFGDAAGMATELTRIAAKYADRPAVTSGNPRLPTVNPVRLAVNVAAADNRPLVAVVGPELSETVRRLAWDGRFAGRFVFTATADAKELGTVEGVAGPGVYVIAPNEFGDGGRVLASTSQAATVGEALATGLAAFHPAAKEHRDHVRKGKQAGKFWETRLPVTDPMEAKARGRK